MKLCLENNKLKNRNSTLLMKNKGLLILVPETIKHNNLLINKRSRNTENTMNFIKFLQKLSNILG